jgi:hypothetical protein
LAIDGLTFFIPSLNATINELGAFVRVETGQDLGVRERIGPACPVSVLKAESVRWHFTSVPSPGLLMPEKEARLVAQSEMASWRSGESGQHGTQAITQ